MNAGNLPTPVRLVIIGSTPSGVTVLGIAASLRTPPEELLEAALIPTVMASAACSHAICEFHSIGHNTPVVLEGNGLHTVICFIDENFVCISTTACSIFDPTISGRGIEPSGKIHFSFSEVNVLDQLKGISPPLFC